ncbi:isoleucine--tRNA ligase, partial [Candidatus Pacearchaeota archaeon]|nr:isoleucine--tRNA ligase [Candidatus Pacearchaeota archaeon]
VHVCPRCETAVAYNEIEYKKQKDTSIFLKFPLKEKKNTFLIIWTTTPWTLPANTGVMVNPDILYNEVETAEGEHWIIAKDLVPKVMSFCERSFSVIKEFNGKEMEGKEYENPLAKNLKLNVKNGYKVVLSARYVTTESGSGLVHCAPGHGKEDYEVGKSNGLDMLSPVQMNGLFDEEAGKYAGKKVGDINKEIIEDLKNSGNLIYTHIYEHDYPTCWRDSSPLLMIAVPQWFLRISNIQKKLLKENDKTNWIPDWMKLRMKAWLEGIGDWPISRQRYWGTPLPIWYDPDSGEKIVVGSLKELKKLSGVSKINIHKPGIDDIIIKEKSGKTLKRVPEVLDVWFDSGVSSWAALSYLSNKKKFRKYWPANLNVEGKDQIRGWWNSQIILSQIVFDKRPFDNILVHGLILDLGKVKMSKSKGNIITPEDIIEKYGRDFLRYYFAKFSKGEDFSFNENEMQEIQKLITILWNINSFVNQLQYSKGKVEIEDKWIYSKYNSLLEKLNNSYEKYKFYEVVSEFENFIINDLSRTYIQIVRERADEVYPILDEIRKGMLKVLAPIMPFTTETLWQSLKEKEIVKEESVHLSDWPQADKKKISSDLEKEFSLALSIIELGLAERDKAKIGLKWPLAKATILSNYKINSSLQEIIAKQLNVKKIDIKIINESKEKLTEKIKVDLDIILTRELEGEGFARELSRKIQAERKARGLVKKDKISLFVQCDSDVKYMLQKHLSFLKERTNSNSFDFVDGKIPEDVIVFTVREKIFRFFFRNF